MKRNLLTPLLLALCLLVLTGAAPTTQPGITVERDLVYTTVNNTALHLDIAMPAAADKPCPTIVFLHGGGWKSGHRHGMHPLMEGAAKLGYVGVSVQYRLVPAAHFPAQVEDCKTAIRWLRAHADQYHIQQDRLGVVGFSAGAHLACMLGVTDKTDGLEGADNLDISSKVQAVVSFCGRTDFSTRDWAKPLEQDVIAPFLGGTFEDIPDVYKKASPISYVTKLVKEDAPPFLLFHGVDDDVVPVDQSKRLAEKLKSVGVSAEAVILPGERHGFSGQGSQKSMKQMLDFLDVQLKKQR